jgi:ribosomal protein L19E
MRVDGIGGVGKRRGEESKRKRSSGSIVGPASRLGRKEARAVPETSWDCGE